jgi:hypothetical protein
VHVIDRLEAVDVDERENEPPIRPAGPGDLPLELGQAALTPKHPGQPIDACLRPFATGPLAIVRRLLPIPRRPGSVARPLLSVACRVLELAPREAAARPLAFTGRAVAPTCGTVTYLGRAVARLRRAVALVDPPRFLSHDYVPSQRPYPGTGDRKDPSRFRWAS